MQGRLPDPFAEPAGPPFSLTAPGGEGVGLTIIASYSTRELRQGPFIRISSETPFFLTAPWQGLNARLEATLECSPSRVTSPTPYL